MLEYILPYLPRIFDGLLLSIKLFVIVLLIAFPLAIIFAIMKVSAPKVVKAILSFYTWVFRGTPIVLQLYIVYYGFPNLGIVLDGWSAAIVVFVLSVAAYETEIIRGGIISIDKGQFEACKMLGMNFIQTMSRVVIPQTVRKVLPPTCSEAIILFKDTSLVAAIAVFDLLRVTRDIAIRDMRIDSFVVALMLYLLISSIMVIVFGRLEKRFSVGFD